MTVDRAVVGLIVAVILPAPETGRNGAPQTDLRPAVTQQAALDPIPTVQEPAASEDVLRRVYEFTARHENVVRYIPCFCGCETFKHQSIESCFVSARAADGRVTWSRHGGACPICIDVLESVRELHTRGHTVRDIRRRIMETFRTGRMTPTPDVPPHDHEGR